MFRGIRWQWRYLVDQEVERAYFISPIFGSLHSYELDSFDALKIGARRLRLLGCTPTTHRQSHWPDLEVIPPSRELSVNLPDPRVQQWRTSTQATLRFCPLVVFLHALELRSRTRAKLEYASSIAEVIEAWKFSRGPECLPRAIFRFKELRARCLDPHLVIGTHLPTDRMHAWIELDSKILGEEPDEMVCYQGAVRYFAG